MSTHTLERSKDTVPRPPDPALDGPRSRRAFLRSVELFRQLPDAALDRLALSFEHQRYGDGDVIFRQGEQGDRMFLVVDGRVDLLREDQFGGQHRLGSVAPGAYFGELALLSDTPRAASAVVVGQAELLSISGREVKRLLAESTPALRSMMGHVGEYRPPEARVSLWSRLARRNRRQRRVA